MRDQTVGPAEEARLGRRPERRRETLERRDAAGSVGTPGRQALYEAGRSVISEYGYTGATVDQIVGRAGLAKGAFYHYWSSKDDLLREILASVLGAQCELAERSAAEAGPPLERLGDFIVGLVELVVEHRDEVKIFHAEIDTLKNPAFSQIRELSAGFHAAIRRIVDQGVAAGELHEVGAGELPGWIIAGTCGYAYRWWPLESGRSSAEVGSMIRNLLLGGLQARRPSSESTSG